MAIRKLPSGKFQVDVWPAGRAGPRVRRNCATRNQAKQVQAELILRYQSAPDRFSKDERRLSELVTLWYQLHGVTLKDCKYRYSRTLAICTELGDPKVCDFTTALYAAYRTNRIRKVSVSTVNHETRYLRAVFSELKRLGQFNGENPLVNIRTFTEVKRELSYLEADQEKAIFTACANSRNTHCLPVARLCLATGARWNEANGLRAQDLHDDYVVYVDTKNGSNRVVPIDPKLSRYLRRVGFPVRRGQLFDTAYAAFKTAVARSGVELPRGQLTHVLRHTFASRLIMRGVDIVTVQRALGHSDITITMRYAHLAPDYMRKIVEVCPLDMSTVDIPL